MSQVLPLAVSLVEHHLDATMTIERTRLRVLRDHVERYAFDREAFTVNEQLHAWGIVDGPHLDRCRASVRTSLDALLQTLDAELGLRRPLVVGASPAAAPSEPDNDSPPTDTKGGLGIEPDQATCSPHRDEPPGLERLRADRRAVAIFGGDVRGEKCALVAEMIGRDAPWFTTRQASQLERSIKRGRVAAVILLEGLIGHVACAQIRAACRRRGVPTAFADRGGTRRLRDAVIELESKSGRAAQAAE